MIPVWLSVPWYEVVDAQLLPRQGRLKYGYTPQAVTLRHWLPKREGAHEVGRTAYVTACGVCLLLALHEPQAFEDPCRERLEVVPVHEKPGAAEFHHPQHLE